MEEIELEKVSNKQFYEKLLKVETVENHIDLKFKNDLSTSH